MDTFLSILFWLGVVLLVAWLVAAGVCQVLNYREEGGAPRDGETGELFWGLIIFHYVVCVFTWIFWAAERVDKVKTEAGYDGQDVAASIVFALIILAAIVYQATSGGAQIN